MNFTELLDTLRKKYFPQLSHTTLVETLDIMVQAKSVSKKENTPRENSTGNITSNTIYSLNKNPIASYALLDAAVRIVAKDQRAPLENKLIITFYIIQCWFRILNKDTFQRIIYENKNYIKKDKNKKIKMFNLSIHAAEYSINEYIDLAFENNFGYELLPYVDNLLKENGEETDRIAKELTSKLFQQDFKTIEEARQWVRKIIDSP